MKEPGYYPPGAEHDKQAPFNQDDIEETTEYQEALEKLYQERIKDLNGWFLESITEAPDSWLQELSALVLLWGNSSSDRAKDIQNHIGWKVIERIDEYCLPDKDDVLEVM